MIIQVCTFLGDKTSNIFGAHNYFNGIPQEPLGQFDSHCQIELVHAYRLLPFGRNLQENPKIPGRK